MPLKFTDQAREALASLLDTEEHEPEHLIRMLSDIYGGFHLIFDERKETDQVVEFEGRPILVVDAAISEHLVEHIHGDTLDVEMTDDGPSLRPLPSKAGPGDKRPDPFGHHSHH